MIIRLAILLLLLACQPAAAAAVAVFSNTGPDAAGFGAAENYPIGTPQTANQQRNMVGAYSHYDALLPTRPVPRAAKSAPFTRAAQELALSYTHQGAAHDLADYLDRHPTTGL